MFLEILQNLQENTSLYQKKLQRRNHRTTLMNVLENIPISLSAVSGNSLIGLFLYGVDKFDDTNNWKILVSELTSIKD